MRRPTGTPTALNISVLRQLAAGGREFSNALAATDVAHIRRCMNAGLVEVINRTTLRLTDEGVAAVGIG